MGASRGLHRGSAGPAPVMHRAVTRTQSRIASLVSRSISAPCAINARPPPDQPQTNTGPPPDRHQTAPRPPGLLQSAPSILSSGRRASLATGGTEESRLHKPNQLWQQARLKGVLPDPHRR